MRLQAALIRPPTLNVAREGNASRLELFFDLAYVLVVMQLASAFMDNLSWVGFGVLSGLFVAVWFSWVGFTLYANRFDTDDVVFRLAKLAATLTVAGCAAAASGAVGEYAVPFAGCYLAGRLILLALYLRAWRHIADARPTISVYLACVGLSAGFWAVSLVTPGDLRYLIWAVAVLVDAVGPVLATLREDKLPLQIQHLPERFGLLVILVLGEAVGGAVRGVHDAFWAPSAVLVAAVGFLVAAGMWWVYFDVGGTDSADELEEAAEGEDADHEAVDERHDLFVYGHLPLTFGIVLVGVGVEELALHPAAALPSAYGWALSGGVALFLFGVALIVGGTFRTWRSVLPWPLGGLPVLLAVTIVPHQSALLMVSAVAVIVVILAVLGSIRSRRSSSRELDEQGREVFGAD